MILPLWQWPQGLIFSVICDIIRGEAYDYILREGENMKKRLRNLLKNEVGILTGLLALIALCFMMLSGCGKAGAEGKPTADVKNQSVRRTVTDDFSVTIRPGAEAKDGIYAKQDVGSHVMYVTCPKLDDKLQRDMDEYHMAAVEVYFCKEGEDVPKFEAEPETSAVYYFFQDSAKEITISWQDPEGAGTLVTGAHLDDPSYVMKYLVTGRKGEPEAIDCLSVSDFTGGEVYFSNVKNSRFTVDSLTIDSETLRDSALAGEL